MPPKNAAKFWTVVLTLAQTVLWPTLWGQMEIVRLVKPVTA